MNFETDKQTLDDLNILGKYKNNSIYSLFDGVATRGGELLLEEMFLHPLTNAKDINLRVKTFRYFKEHSFSFPGEASVCDMVEQYVDGSSGKHWIVNYFRLLRLKCFEFVTRDRRYEAWREQVTITVHFFAAVRVFLRDIVKSMSGHPLEERVKRGLELLESPEAVRILSYREGEMGISEILLRDRYFCYVKLASFRELLTLLHELDVCLVVGRVARERQFSFPEACEDDLISISVKGLHHPNLPGAISNNMEITRKRNIFFLTGANMAGKSTLMKSFGIAVYMAHMGFPVAAKSMKFSVQDGIYTSINVPDNINMGYSHFYAEVLRVKKVAEEVSKSKRLVVIFDELFKGTNVKDAYDATLAVSAALAKRHLCSFLVSTHIIEVGEELGKKCDNVTFAYLPTVMRDNVPTYTYRLEPGITEDKHGMIIINNERIVEIIRGQVD